jgi:hypothetical protein
MAADDAGLPGGPYGYDCTSDADCTAGTNGRCLMRTGGGPAGPLSSCSYDRCFDDSECSKGTICNCRESNTSFDENACYPAGACRLDSDCGPNGYCSPSLINAVCACWGPAPQRHQQSGMCFVNGLPAPCETDVCGHGYFCHTKSDICVDDSDCVGGTCNYNMFEARWSCSACR